MPENFANRYQTALSAGVTSGALTGTVTSTTGIPARPFRAIISSEGANTDEIVLVTGLSGSTLTWTRAIEAVAGVQAASAHSIGATLTAIVTAAGLTYVGEPPGYLRKVSDKLSRMAAGGTGNDSNLRILLIGDSMAGIKLTQMEDDVQGALPGGRPVGGYASGPFFSSITNNGDTGSPTQILTRFDAIFTGRTTRFTGGATRKYGSGGVSASWSEVTIYYVKEPGAGTFKVQVDGVDEGAAINAANATIDVGMVKITRADALTQREVKVVNLTGTIDIIDVYIASPTSGGGVVWMMMAEQGLTIADALSTTTGRDNTTVIIADLAPDVVFFEMKETAADMAANLPSLLTMLASAVPNADVVIVGSTPVLTNNDNQLLTNEVARVAAQQGAIYWDGYTPAESYAAMDALDWEGDGTHPAAYASAFLGSLMLHQLGWWVVPGMLQPRDVNASSVQAVDYLALGITGPNSLGGVEVSRITPDATFKLDVDFWVRRNLNFSGPNGTAIFRFALGSGGDSYIPEFIRIGPAGPYLTGFGGAVLYVMANGGNQAPMTASELRVESTKVVGVRKTGWTAATGTPTRTTFATSTVTTQQLAERVKALIDDLIAHGLIGS